TGVRTTRQECFGYAQARPHSRNLLPQRQRQEGSCMSEAPRTFLFDVRPGHRETLDSYSRRVFDANFTGPWLRTHLLNQCRDVSGKTEREVAWSEILAAKTGRPVLQPGDRHAWLRHRDGTSCEFCTDMLSTRWMCTRCAH